MFHSHRIVFCYGFQLLIPIVLSLVLMVAYLFFGAIIYVEWEGWSLSDAIYFTFVTLTTIGFGDLVSSEAVLARLGKQGNNLRDFRSRAAALPTPRSPTRPSTESSCSPPCTACSASPS